MVAQVSTTHDHPTHQTIALGRVILSVPVGVDSKPYIRQILALEVATILNPIAKAALESGLATAVSDADFSSLLETFHLLSSPSNADRLIAALECCKTSEVLPQSVAELRQELGLVEEAP
jgi:hypothetical protein